MPILLHVAQEDYAYRFQLNADVIVLCLGLLVAYWYAVTQLRSSVPDAGRIKHSQSALFGLGVLSLYAAGSSPLHEIAEGYLASAHMLQHLLLTMVAPPLLLAGTPGWLVEAALRGRRAFTVARYLTVPLVAFALFNSVQLVTHLPVAVDLSLRVHWFHFVVHVVLVSAALLMWWPILSPSELLPRLSYPLQMAYLFVQSLLPSILAAFLTFSDGVFYRFYGEAPRSFGLSMIEDQQLAGFVMKILGSLILWGFIAVAFFKWYEKENAESQEPRWDEVQDELRRIGL